MNKLATAAALLALLPVMGIASAAAAGGLAQPDAAGSGRTIVPAGGMGGGSTGGMGGSTGGMGGGAAGTRGGAFGMGGGGGHFGGGMFGGQGDFAGPSQAASDNRSSAPPDNYTYQCVTPAGRCSFVAPAALRANSLRSGADCGCGGGQQQGRIE